MNIAPPDANSSIIDDAGRMVQRFRSWSRALSRLSILEGSGSPEAVVEALPTRLYMDTAGTAGSILYVKRDADDGLGDKTKGWVLV
jgi:hypothetical protein